MEIYIGEQLNIVVYSVILGLIFGLLYDIIRIVHILCGIASYQGEKRGMAHGALPFTLFFITDLAYMLCVTAIYSVFIYWSMNGRFRLFVLVSVIAGFVLYYNTVGRVVMFFSEIIAGLIRLLFNYVIVIPLRFIARVLYLMLRFIYAHTVRAVYLRMISEWRKLRSYSLMMKLQKDLKL